MASWDVEALLTSRFPPWRCSVSCCFCKGLLAFAFPFRHWTFLCSGMRSQIFLIPHYPCAPWSSALSFLELATLENLVSPRAPTAAFDDCFLALSSIWGFPWFHPSSQFQFVCPVGLIRASSPSGFVLNCIPVPEDPSWLETDRVSSKPPPFFLQLYSLLTPARGFRPQNYK